MSDLKIKSYKTFPMNCVSLNCNNSAENDPINAKVGRTLDNMVSLCHEYIQDFILLTPSDINQPLQKCETLERFCEPLYNLQWISATHSQQLWAPFLNHYTALVSYGSHSHHVAWAIACQPYLWRLSYCQCSSQIWTAHPAWGSSASLMLMQTHWDNCCCCWRC